MELNHESPLTEADIYLQEQPSPKRQRTESTETAEPEPTNPHAAGSCGCRTEVERQPWKPPDLPEGHSYYNIKVKFHEDFDIVAAARSWYNTEHPLLIVKHTRPKSGAKDPHWHIHGAIADVFMDGYRKVWKKNKKTWPHPLHAERGPKGRSIKPYSSKIFDTGPWENGYMYCVKPHECIGGCPVVEAIGISDSDMYQIMEQSREHFEANNLTFEQEEKDFTAAILDAQKHADPAIQHWKLYGALFKFYTDHNRVTYNVLKRTTHLVGAHSPEGLEYIYRCQWTSR